MKHGSLFSGIGGFDLAAEWMGWKNVFHCEWNEFGQKVLKHYWPNADSYTDITKTNFKKYEGTIDIISGGFPCQPFSSAGKRKGTNDERYLWHEMLRAIQEIKPKFIIAENVYGITNIDGGMVFEQVCLDLETEGYEVQPFIIPAAAKNAPHRRDRCWFIAYSNGSMLRTNEHRGVRCENGENKSQRLQGIYNAIRSNGNSRIITNPNSNGLNECNCNNEINASERGINALGNIEQSIVDGNATDTSNQGLQGGQFFGTFKRREWQQNDTRKSVTELYQITNWHLFPTQSPICGGDDGLPTELDGITFPKWRNESIKGYGNAICPQIALELFKVIDSMNL